MSVAWRYTPPTVDAAAAVHVAAEVAVQAAAAHLLDASRRLVPVDTGALKDSGRVTHDGLEAAVSYGDDGDPTGIYAPIQHERLDYHHPNGGSAKFLEQPMHSEAETIAQSLAETLRRALQA